MKTQQNQKPGAYLAHVRAMRHQRGQSMIEVLVAILVLAVGLLGLAGLQANGIKVTQGATLRWKASELAVDLADRMRSDKTDFTTAPLPSAASPCVVRVSAGAVALTGTCPPGFAATTLTDWANNQLVTLPSGQMALAASPTGDWEVDIGWDDTRASTIAASTAVSGSSGGGYAPAAVVVTGTTACGNLTLTGTAGCTKLVTRLL